MEKQVFQTDDKSRWIKFKWSLRVLAVFAAILVTALVIMLLIDKTPAVPYKQSYKNIVSADKPYFQETKISKEYKGFRSFIQ